MQLNNNKTLISVIVVAYNEAKHVEECLISIKNQSYPYIELIVVDDGSTDGTRDIAIKYADLYLSQNHKGPGLARNLGAKYAKGKILVFIDADMYLSNDYVKNIIKPILENKSNATFTKEEYVANIENIWSKCFQIDNNLHGLNRIKYKKIFAKKFRAIKKETFVKNNGYLINVGYGEDEVLKRAESIVAPNAICFHYNPDTLLDVYISARWMGRSKYVKRTYKNIFRYSFLNSLSISYKKINHGAPFLFVIYKLVFDFGILMGILNKKKEEGYAK